MQDIVVSIIEPVGGHGGMNYYDFGLATGLGEAGCKVALYTCDETQKRENANFEFTTPFRKIYGGAPKILRALRFLSGVFRSLIDSRRRGASIVHLHFFHAGILENVLVNLVKVFGFKLVLTVHDVESFAGAGTTKSAKRIFSRSDLLIAHNEVSVRELVEKLKIPPEKIKKIPHGNYLDFVEPRDRLQSRRDLGLPEDAKIVLFFGQIKTVKGLDLLIEAIAKIKIRQPKLILLIAGKVWKDDFSRYQRMIDDLALNGNVIAHVKYIPDSAVASYYAAADIVALPYRKIYQSGVLLMAMSLGSIVVASSLSGMLEVIEDGVNGFIFESEDVTALSEKIELSLALRNPSEIARSAYDLMSSDYSWSKIGRDTLDAYLSMGKK